MTELCPLAFSRYIYSYPLVWRAHKHLQTTNIYRTNKRQYMYNIIIMSYLCKSILQNILHKIKETIEYQTQKKTSTRGHILKKCP